MAAIRTQREIRQRAPWWLIALLALNFGVMTYDARDVATQQRKIRTMAQTVADPFERAVSGDGNCIGGFFGSFGELRRGSGENQQLREQVKQMQIELRDTAPKAAEAERLEKLLALSTNLTYKTVAARVIARDPSMWFDNITIDKGRWAGVEVNMPVVTAEGIVGRVISTSPLNAQVMLITNEKSRDGAIVGELGQSSALGSINGLGESELLEMRFDCGDEQVQTGDVVKTTAQEANYPPGYH